MTKKTKTKTEDTFKCEYCGTDCGWGKCPEQEEYERESEDYPDDDWRLEDDGQPDEAQEWHDFDPDC